jgi:hypothetical protein
LGLHCYAAGEPSDLRQPIADSDQTHPTVLAAMRANAGDLLKRHIDHAAHPQQIFVRLTVFPHGKLSLRIEESAQQLAIYCSGLIPSFISKNGNPLDAFDRLAARLVARHLALGHSPER